MIPQPWQEPIGQWRSWLTAAGRSTATQTLRLHQIRRFAETAPDPWTATTQQLVDWLSNRSWSAETRRSHRAALVSFYSWAVRAGHIPTDPTLALPASPPGKHLPRPTPEPIVKAALEIRDPRTRLMVALAARQGLRRGEISRIHSDDLSRDYTGRWSLRVRGKGDKVRIIPLWDEIGSELARLPAGWAFPGSDDGHLSPAWVGRVVSRALPAGWTTHTLRHRFATAAYRGSRDLIAVQDLLGHAKPETTRLYVLPPDDGMRDALRHAA